jgi:glycosyltransferase involved in cell wall biosynthesis
VAAPGASGRVLMFVVNDPAFFMSHRAALGVAAQREGFVVHVATGPGADIDRIVALGFVHHPLPMSRTRTNPLKELRALLAIYRLFRRERPALVHLVTIKPVTYGGIAARLARVPAVVAAVSGLGFVFLSRGVKPAIVRITAKTLYRLAFGHRNLKVILQNPDDREMLVRIAGLDPARTVIIRGSGVDLSAFRVAPEPPGAPVVLMPARMLIDKGIREFVEAARQVRARGVDVCFQVAGDIDPQNPASVTQADVDTWRREGIVSFLGFRDDIPELMAESAIVALPSYREGLPKALVDAAAAGRPSITTDVPGCRDAIEPEVTGLLVPVKDARALADAIATLASQPERRRQMGAAARNLAEQEFAIAKIVAAHLAIYRELVYPTYSTVH